jgi:hypothetical protein
VSDWKLSNEDVNRIVTALEKALESYMRDVQETKMIELRGFISHELDRIVNGEFQKVMQREIREWIEGHLVINLSLRGE